MIFTVLKSGQRERYYTNPRTKFNVVTRIIEQYPTIVDLLSSFPHTHIPAIKLLTLLPHQAPRFYSICSSLKHIQISVTQVSDKPTRGICSEYLCHSAFGDKARVYICPTNFHAPEDPLIPVIMIGPGICSAPFRGFLEARRDRQEKSLDIGFSMLFFGCRRMNSEGVFMDEWYKSVNSGTLSKLELIFSREVWKTTIFIIIYFLLNTYPIF